MENTVPLQEGNSRTERPSARNRILSARLTEPEYAALEKQAWSKGMTVGDWTREVLVRNLNSFDKTALAVEIFTELVAIELAIMNGLEPLLCGEKLSHEQAAGIFRQVQTAKAPRAQELLVKRGIARRK